MFKLNSTHDSQKVLVYHVDGLARQTFPLIAFFCINNTLNGRFVYSHPEGY